MRQNLFLFALLFGVVLAAVGSVLAEPFGANSVTQEATSSSNGSNYPPSSHGAYAGNVTEITVDGASVTQTWQGYYGNVTGSITLENAQGDVFYNWTGTVDPSSGEVYASTNDSLTWTEIGCYNLTEPTGYNLTLVEAQYNIASTDGDGLDETFTLNNHAAFTTGTTSFSGGDCNNTQLFDSGGSGSFDEVLLYENSTSSLVFASLIQDNGDGFDAATHDFQMLVLEDGHSGDTATTTYYFWVELD